MKTIVKTLATATFFAASTGAFAQGAGDNMPAAQGSGGGVQPIPYVPAYTGPSAVPTMTVAQALARARDDEYVTLRGKIVQYLGNENYMFADSTGSIHVDIDRKKFPPGQQVGADTLVEITGEFDREYIGHSKIDVSTLRIVGR